MGRGLKLKIILALVLMALFAGGVLVVSSLEKAEVANALEAPELTVTNGGSPVTSLLLEQNEKQTLTAEGLPEEADYQWQILMPDTSDTWVKIYNRTESVCELSRALVKSMMSASGKAVVRCTAVYEGETYFSDPVYITVNPGEEGAAAEALSFDSIAETAQNVRIPGRRAAALMSADVGAEDDMVSIIIHYQLEDGTKVFDDYVARLVDGSSFSASVPSPTHVGYAAYIRAGEDEGYEDYEGYKKAEKLDLNYTNLHNDVELTVVFLPAQAPYIARYYLQNVSNDLYTEDTSRLVSDTALTGTYPAEVIDKEIPGFTVLYHLPEVVAADGSTEFNCFYDRNYYLYNFNCNGGYGVEPVYARYGTTLIVNSPTRSGYVFKGWDRQEEDGSYDGVADALPSSIGIGNETYRAIWEAVETTVTIVYWNENADDEKYNYWDSATIHVTSGDKITIDDVLNQNYGIVARPSESVVPDTEFRHYTLNEDRIGSSIGDGIVVEGDGSSIINIFYERKDYTLRFYYARQDRNGKTYVVGGSTWPFCGVDTTDIQKQLENVPSGNWGEVGEIDFNEKGALLSADGTYQTGTETYGNYTYYYFDLTAKYGSSLKELWPTGVFDPVESYSGLNGDYAVFSAWNGEHHVQYSIDNENKTIKGNYIRLDDTILYSYKYQDTYEQDKNGNDLIRYLAFWENGANISWSEALKWTYNIYAEALPRELADPELQDQLVTYGGKQYLLFDAYVCCDNNGGSSGLAVQTPPGTSGFKLNGKTYESDTLTTEEKSIYSSAHIANFYYDRVTYTLRLSSQGEFLTENGTQVPYGRGMENQVKATVESAGGTGLEPPYPDNLEPGAYEFAGWYLSPVFQEGTGLEDTPYMLATDMTFYAYWKPVEHTVTFSDNYNDMLDGVYTNTVSVDHGGYLPTTEVPVPDPSGISLKDYDFRGWFYINESGEKQAFSTGDMPVNSDLHLFAEWQSSRVVEYIVHYVNEAGETVAEDTLGYSYTGMTRTFTAKAGTELYEGYQSHYYPLTNTHSILMKEPESGSENEYTFVYRYMDSVTYTVRYVDSATGRELLPSKTVKTEAAVITEKYEFISGYIPDAFYKRLILTATETENVITFYYTSDAEHAFYVVKHMIEEVDGTYSEYSSVEAIGDLYTELPVQAPLAISGFAYNQEMTEKDSTNIANGVKVSSGGVTGTVTEDGLEMVIYYSREEYDYEICFVEYGNQEHVLRDSITGSAKFGYTIALDLENVELMVNGQEVTIIPDPGTDSLTSIIAEDGTVYRLADEANTVRTRDIRANDEQKLYIYYLAQKSNINYIAVSNYPGAVDFGEVSLSSETVASTAAIVGSTPTPGTGYRFAGWFIDAACTQPVEEGLVDGDTGKITPSDISKEVSYYYALFVPRTADLTITKQGVADEDQNQTFLFQITGMGRSSTVDMTVSITGNGSVTIADLPVGSYYVTEISGWSWRYETKADGPERQRVIVEDEKENTVIFVNESKDTAWLGGEGSKDNRFEAVP